MADKEMDPMDAILEAVDKGTGITAPSMEDVKSQVTTWRDITTATKALELGADLGEAPPFLSIHLGLKIGGNRERASSVLNEANAILNEASTNLMRQLLAKLQELAATEKAECSRLMSALTTAFPGDKGRELFRQAEQLVREAAEHIKRSENYNKQLLEGILKEEDEPKPPAAAKPPPGPHSSTHRRTHQQTSTSSNSRHERI